MSGRAGHGYVGRGGLKLQAALDAFGLDVAGLTCADFGCNVGGFTDCLLQRGAAMVYAVDTAYGVLDYRLRTDPRVVVTERTNALHANAPESPVDLVVIDAGWTPQRLIVPNALRWLDSRPTGRIVTLIKPHYERAKLAADATDESTSRSKGRRGGRPATTILPEAEARRVFEAVIESLPALGVRVLGSIRSPIHGGGSRGKEGNVEYLALLAPDPQ